MVWKRWCGCARSYAIFHLWNIGGFLYKILAFPCLVLFWLITTFFQLELTEMFGCEYVLTTDRISIETGFATVFVQTDIAFCAHTFCIPKMVYAIEANILW